MVYIFPTLLIVCLFTGSKASWEVIYPNTNWCGILKGDMANISDLGSLDQLDKCCRTHAYCPISINAFETQYGISNTGATTVYDCACEDVLYECLKAVDISQQKHANAVGMSYFNMLQPKCIKKETTCVSSSNSFWTSIRRCVYRSGYKLFSGRRWE
ncbi:phospholipase A2-like [Mytilus trossulus]|uniref:phospholipase A2-like n=1 Tax=Mytilus trossulus TaxID=6551 RepID=UPI0030051C37